MHADERTVNQPDMLYGAYIGSYEALPTQETVSLPVRLQPLQKAVCSGDCLGVPLRVGLSAASPRYAVFHHPT